MAESCCDRGSRDLDVADVGRLRASQALEALAMTPASNRGINRPKRWWWLATALLATSCAIWLIHGNTDRITYAEGFLIGLAAGIALEKWRGW